MFSKELSERNHFSIIETKKRLENILTGNQPTAKEHPVYRQLLEVVDNHGLEGLYQQLDKMDVSDLQLDTSDFLHLLLRDREHLKSFYNLPLPIVNDIYNTIQEERKPVASEKQFLTKEKIKYKKHPIVKEKNGEGVDYIENLTFKNWDKSITSHPAITFFPKTEEGMRACVEYGRANGKEVGMSGYRHTASNVFPRKGQYLISTIDLKTATEIPATFPEPDPSNELKKIKITSKEFIEDGVAKIEVTIGGAVTNDELDRWIHAKDGCDSEYTLPFNVVMKEITVSGATRMGCHGAGIKFPTLSDLITRIQFVNPNGKLQVITDPEQIKAAACDLGSLGPITELTMKFDKMTYANLNTIGRRLLVETIPLSKKYISKNFQNNLSQENLQSLLDKRKQDAIRAEFIKTIEESHYNEFFFTGTQEGYSLCWKNNGDKSKAVRFPSPEVEKKHKRNTYIAYLANNLVGDSCPIIRKIQAKILSLVEMANLPKDNLDVHCSVTDGTHFYGRYIQNLPATMMEVEIPITDDEQGNPDWDLVFDSWTIAINTYFSEKYKDTVPMRLPMEMRIMGGSNVYLAPQYKNKRTIALEVLTPNTVKTENFREYAQDILDKLVLLKDKKGNYLNIRFHLAKGFDYLKINRPLDWLEQLSEEDKNVAQQYIDPKTNLISMPAIDYLKYIAYKEQINLFLQNYKKICQAGNYSIEQSVNMFANDFVRNFIFDERVVPKKEAQVSVADLAAYKKLSIFSNSHSFNLFYKNEKKYKNDELKDLLAKLKVLDVSAAKSLIAKNLKLFDVPTGLITKVLHIESKTHHLLKNLINEIDKSNSDDNNKILSKK